MINERNIPLTSDDSELRELNSDRQTNCHGLVFMRDRFIALTNDGVYEVEGNTLTTQILDVYFGAGDVFGRWSLEIQFHMNSEQPYWKEYYSAEASPERLMATEFYEALADLEAAYPEKQDIVFEVLIAIYGERTFYSDWDKEECWKRAMTFYTFDQMGGAV